MSAEYLRVFVCAYALKMSADVFAGIAQMLPSLCARFALWTRSLSVARLEVDGPKYLGCLSKRLQCTPAVD